MKKRCKVVQLWVPSDVNINAVLTMFKFNDIKVDDTGLTSFDQHCGDWWV